jgi:hypothetical protein
VGQDGSRHRDRSNASRALPVTSLSRNVAICVLVALWLAPLSAVHAGQRPFLFAYDTNIVSSGNIELEQWLWASGPAPAQRGPAIYWLWWGPVVGINPHLELAVPFQVKEVGGTTELASFDADLRWRLFPQDDRSGFQALLRTSYHQATVYNASLPTRFDSNLSFSYGGRRMSTRCWSSDCRWRFRNRWA